MHRQHATLRVDRIDAVIFGTECIIAPGGRTKLAAAPSAVALLRALRDHGMRTAAVSTSRRGKELLRLAHVWDLFDVHVDGTDAARLGFATWPDPALPLEATRQLGVSPRRAAIVESGADQIEGAWRGGFSVVLGVDDDGTHQAEYGRHGANVIVPDLASIELKGPRDEPLLAYL